MLFTSAGLLLLGISLLDVSSTSGLKMTVRHTMGGMSSEQIVYLATDRRRMEYRNLTAGARRWNGSTDVRYGPRLASITLCDLGQAFDLNLDTGEYTTAPYPPRPLSKEEAEALGLKVPAFAVSGKPALRIETTTVDTGERKEIFGHTARHVITTRDEEGSESDARQMVTDGWYIDLDTSISCDHKNTAGNRVHAFLTAGNLPAASIEFVDRGEPETGFAIEWKTSSLEAVTLPDGTKKDHSSTSDMRVTQLVAGPLDPALFTIPKGFRRVEHLESNPPSNLPSQWSIAWRRVKESITRLFR